MAKFNPPFAYNGERRSTTLDEQEFGIPCGPFDREMWNNLFHNTQAELGNLVSLTGQNDSENDFEQVAKAVQSGALNYVVAGGTANAITGILTPSVAAYHEGLEVRVRITTNNTGPVTLDLGGGPKPVMTISGVQLRSSDLVASGIYSFFYNGLNWVVRPEGLRSLDGNITLYVRADGDDDNDGEADTAASAFRNIQRAVDVAQQRYVSTSYSITIRCSDGIYNSFSVNGGASTRIKIFGNDNNPEACIISATGTQIAVNVSVGSTVSISGFIITGGRHLVTSGDRSSVSIGKIFLGNCTDYQIYAHSNSCIYIESSLTVSGGGRSLYVSSAGGAIISSGNGQTCTFSKAVKYSTATAWGNNGTIIATGTVYIGAGNVIGPRYQADVTGVIYTAGGGANFFPGSVAGSVATGGVYA